MSKMGKRLAKAEEERGKTEKEAHIEPQLKPETKRVDYSAVSDRVAKKLDKIGVEYERNAEGPTGTASFLCYPTEVEHVDEKKRKKTRYRQGEVILIAEDGAASEALGLILFLKEGFPGNTYTVAFPQKVDEDVKRIYAKYNVGAWYVPEEPTIKMDADEVNE